MMIVEWFDLTWMMLAEYSALFFSFPYRNHFVPMNGVVDLRDKGQASL
jgi:hypothetical protein